MKSPGRITARNRATGIHHVQVAMPRGGEEQARDFYRGVLGFEEIEKPDTLRGRGGLWFQTGNLQLHLGVDPDFHPAAKAHVAYEVPNLEEMRGRFARAGYSTMEDEPLPGYDRFYTIDPFGNRVEVLNKSEKPL